MKTYENAAGVTIEAAHKPSWGEWVEVTPEAVPEVPQDEQDPEEAPGDPEPSKTGRRFPGPRATVLHWERYLDAAGVSYPEGSHKAELRALAYKHFGVTQ